ncbi:MAG: class I SAM-dependent methyltransferase [Nanoarchaeota archaeon]
MKRLKDAQKDAKIERIQRIDRGKDFGRFGLDARRLFVDETRYHIEPLCEHIRKYKSLGDLVEIADVGGGNGILAKAVLDELGEEYPHLTIDLLDLDDSKFPNGEKRIRYVVHDAREPLGKQYDALLARSMLHYNTPAEQKQIIAEMATGTRAGGLVTIVQPTPMSRKNKKEINGLYDLLCGMKSSNKKCWLTLAEITRLVERSGLQIQESKWLENGKYTVDGFYKERYKLSDEEIEKVRTYLAGRPGVYMPTSVITAIRR